MLMADCLHKLVRPEKVDEMRTVVEDLHDTMMDFRARYGAGRAIAAPQIGVMKRLVYMYIDEPVTFINCMSFPELLVKVKRHKQCYIVFQDLDWREQRLDLEGDLSELLQHEVDHLDGTLSIHRALDNQSIALRSQKALLNPM